MPAYRKARRVARKGYRFYRRNQSTADKALSIALKTAAMLNPEYKVHTTGLSSAVSTTAQFTSLGSVAQGDGMSNRDGQSIKVTSLAINGRYLLNASASADHIRTIVFVDKNSDGATPSVLELLESNDPMSHLNVESQQNRFRVLYDRLDSLVNDGGDQVIFRKYQKMSHHIKFDSTGASDYSWGNIWIMQLGNQATNTTVNDLNCRIRFVDN